MCYLLMVFGTLKPVVKLVWFLDKQRSEIWALKTLIPLDLKMCLFVFVFPPNKYNLN